MKNRPSMEFSQLLGASQRGFTLLELMVSVTVLGILLALAVPTFKETMLNSRLVAQNNEFIATLNYARSEAIRRSDAVSVCPSTTGTTCAASATDWSTGWITFTDINADGNLNGTDQLLRAGTATTDGISLSSTTLSSISYSGSGMLSSAAGTFSLLKTGCTGDTARQIGISVTGRVSTSKVACP